MPAAPSLRSRAVLSVALYAGFHLLALSIAGALLWLPWAEWHYAGRIHLKLVLVGVGGAYVILKALLPQPERWDPPGPVLSEANQPRLFALVHEVARATNQAAPETVYAVPDVNAFVAEPRVGVRRPRVLGVGLPLLAVLSVGELRSVLAHEFGHYAGGDTRLGGWVWRTRSAIGRTLEALGDRGWLRKPFEWYAKGFLRVSHAVSRRQEFLADEAAARVAGRAAASGALRRIAATAPAFPAYWGAEVAPALGRGFRPPVAAGFAQFVAAAPVRPQVEAGLESALAEQKTDPYDTHPTLRERLAALAALPAGADASASAAPGDDAPALSLLDAPDAVEAAMVALLTDTPDDGDNAVPAPISWEALPARVFPDAWRETVAEHRDGLRGVTPAALPALLADWQGLAVRLGIAPDRAVVRGVQRDDVHRVMGCALALALHAREAAGAPEAARLHAPPGEPVTFRVPGPDGAERVILPFEVPAALGSGALAADAWAELCAAAGVAEADLGAVEPPAGWAPRGRAVPNESAEGPAPAERRRRAPRVRA